MDRPTWLKPDLVPAIITSGITIIGVVVGGSMGYAQLQANDRMYDHQITELKVANERAITALQAEGQRRNDRLDVVLDRFAGQIQDDTNRITRVEAQIATIPWVRK